MYQAVGIIGGGKGIVSGIQRGTIAGALTSQTVTITSVDTANSRIRNLGATLNGGGVSEAGMMSKLQLTNATTITMTINTAGGITATVGYEVTSTVGLYKSFQRGTISGQSTATITSVDTTKTELDNLGNTTSEGNTNIFDTTRITLTNATTVTNASGGGGATPLVSYQSSEFAP